MEDDHLQLGHLLDRVGRPLLSEDRLLEAAVRHAIGAYMAPSRLPPVTTRAPLATASRTHSSTRTASFSRIIGPIWTLASSWLPTLSALTLGRSAERKSS